MKAIGFIAAILFSTLSFAQGQLSETRARYQVAPGVAAKIRAARSCDLLYAADTASIGTISSVILRCDKDVVQSGLAIQYNRMQYSEDTHAYVLWLRGALEKLMLDSSVGNMHKEEEASSSEGRHVTALYEKN